MRICIFICVCTKYHIDLFYVIVLYLDGMLIIQSIHGSGLAYYGILLNKLVSREGLWIFFASK